MKETESQRIERETAEKIAAYLGLETMRWRDLCGRLKSELREHRISEAVFANLHERYDSKVVCLETVAAQIRRGEWR
jgi:hypothetical protein